MSPEILAESIDPALEDYGELLAIFQKRLEEMDAQNSADGMKDEE